MRDKRKEEIYIVSACVKCGWEDEPKASYRSIRHSGDPAITIGGVRLEEHLVLSCRGCGFTTAVPCLDSSVVDSSVVGSSARNKKKE